MKNNPATTIDKYIAAFPKEVRELLIQMRNTIKAAAPKAEEVISYQMPAYKQNGMLVFFAGYAKHIGFYPTGSGIEHFKTEITKYKWSKGAIQFPLDKKLPITLITKIVKYKVRENELKLAANSKGPAIQKK